jgi:hypothetical protein
MTTEPKPKSKPEPIPKTYEGIPLDHFGNDIPYNPNPDDSPGSAYDHLKNRDKKKPDK